MATSALRSPPCGLPRLARVGGFPFGGRPGAAARLTGVQPPRAAHAPGAAAPGCRQPGPRDRPRSVRYLSSPPSSWPSPMVSARVTTRGLAGARARRARTWRWASGTATLSLENPNVGPRAVTLDFQLRSVVARSVTVSVATNPATTERFTLLPDRTLPVRFGPLTAPPWHNDHRLFDRSRPPGWNPGRMAGRWRSPSIAFTRMLPKHRNGHCPHDH